MSLDKRVGRRRFLGALAGAAAALSLEERVGAAKGFDGTESPNYDIKFNGGVVLDYPLMRDGEIVGWFFTQTGSDTPDITDGFAITEEFYQILKERGYVDSNGRPAYGGNPLYPVARRYIDDTKERRVLLFQPFGIQRWPDGKVEFLNIFDEIDKRSPGYLSSKGIPWPKLGAWDSDKGLAWPEIVKNHLRILDPYPSLKRAFTESPNWVEESGLPMIVKDMGPFVVVTGNRKAYQSWNTNGSPETNIRPGDITPVLGGDHYKFAVIKKINPTIGQPHHSDDIPSPIPLIVTPSHPEYYTRYIIHQGLIVKANGVVDSGALEATRPILDNMLGSARPDIPQLLRAYRYGDIGVEIAIIPKKEYITTLPEFRELSGTTTSDGRPYDAFQIRGLGGVRTRPITATAEENLLKLPENNDRNPLEDITFHEFAHTIQELAFTQADLNRWKSIYDSARAANLFPGQYAMVNDAEFWATLSQAFFGVTHRINIAEVRDRIPSAHNFLLHIYRNQPL